MKKTFVTLFLLCFAMGISQEYVKYSKAKITYNSQQNFQKLIKLGIPMDHGQKKLGNSIISDFSEQEIESIKKSGISVEILIDDVTKDFLKRNKQAAKQKNLKNANCNGSASNTTYPTPNNFTLGSMGGYFTYQEMLDNLDAMRAQYPNLISARANIGNFLTNGTPDNSVTPSIGGNALQWVRISDNPDADENEPEILYDAIHHAREPASLSQLIYYMWYLLENYNSSEEIQEIVNNTELYFVPVVNPDGYLYNQKTNPNGGGMWRKNRFNTHGVDLNRNYDYYEVSDDPSTSVWGGNGTSSNTASDVYAGTGPFSEVETQAMKWFTEQHDFKIALNNHTSGDLLLFPFGYEDNRPTPENNLYETISAGMVSQNGFDNMISSGLYPAAGDSDDYMYAGTTASHKKIYAFTPEIGPEFWPTSNQIDGICKSMMYLNLTAAKLTHNYANINNNQPLFIGENTAFNAEFTLERLGIVGNGTFTVSMIPVSTNISSVDSPKTYTNLNLGDTVEDYITINLNPNTTLGEDIIYKIEVDGGTLKQTIEVTNKFGSLQVLVENNANTLTGFTSNGWDTTTATFVSGGASITESPNGNYGSNQNKTIEITDPIDLTTAGLANVQFYAKWDIENNWDYAQFEVSTDDGISWTPQCGRFTNDGSTNSGQPTGEPLYDGSQPEWVLEEIDLSDYLGQTINIRFQFASDTSEQGDGFYFDDIKINTIPSDVLTTPEFGSNHFSIFPNPFKSKLSIQPTTDTNYSVSIFNLYGQEVYKKVQQNGHEVFELQNLKPGFYFINIDYGTKKESFKIIKN